MPRYEKPDNEPEDEIEEDEEEAGFERIRRNTNKTPTIKDDRRQQAKEWGRMHNKFHKQRKKSGDYKKP